MCLLASLKSQMYITFSGGGVRVIWELLAVVDQRDAKPADRSIRGLRVLVFDVSFDINLSIY